jgi:uncharacterized protein (TIGR02266 family)
VTPAPIGFELAYRSPGAFLVAYTTNLVRGGVFVETGAPAPAGSAVTLHLSVPPDAAIPVEGVVTWSRPEPAGPGQPAGMGVALAAPPDALGEAVDRMAFGFAGIQMLVGAGEAAPRAILSRYLRSIITCEIVDVDYETDQEIPAWLEGLDVAVLDLDSSGPPAFDLYARLRAHERAGTAPVVALAQLERDRNRALTAGFDEALANPPVFAELQAAILRCLSRPIVPREP